MIGRLLTRLACCGVVLCSAAPLVAQSTKPPAMTPEQRAQAQAKLNAQARELDAETPIEATKAKLRGDLTPLRDTLIEVSAVVTRLTRAHATNIGSVVTSSAKQLHMDCAVAANVGLALQPNVVGLKTRDARANGFIDKYRATLAELIRSLQTCDKTLTSEVAAKAPNQARLNDAAVTVQASMDRYTEAQRNMLDVLQMKLLPKGYKPRAG